MLRKKKIQKYFNSQKGAEMENYLVDVVFIAYGLILGTLGNLLYRVNNHLKINPIAVRLLYGIMALALYVLMYLGFLKKIPEIDIVVMLLIIVVGYFVELIIEVLEDKVPKALDRLIDKWLGGGNNGDSRSEKDD